MRHRSTLLKDVENHCPAVVTHKLAGTPAEESRVMKVGGAYHAISQGIWQNPEIDPASVGEEVAKQLMSRGRVFEGQERPPLKESEADEALDLSLRLLSVDPVVPGAIIERGMAVNRHWEPVEYSSKEAWWSGIADRMQTYDDEDGDRIFKLSDIKGFPGSQEMTKSLQLRGNLLLADVHGHTDGCDFAIIEVINIQLLAKFRSDPIPLKGQEWIELSDLWRSRIDLWCEAIDTFDRTVEQSARPGPGCIDCQFLLHCKPALDFRKSQVGLPEDREGRARLYAVARAVAGVLDPYVRRDAEAGSIELDSGPEPIRGFRVGPIKTQTNNPKKHAHAEIAAVWEAVGGDMSSLLAAGGLTVGFVKKVAKAIKDKEHREAILSQLEKLDGKRFGIQKRKEK